jgi:hypothetical protein
LQAPSNFKEGILKMIIESNQPSANDIELMEWAAIRAKRNSLIKATDHTQIGDSPLTVEKKAEFTVYRTALRDLPQTYGNTVDVIWPELPQV